MVMVSRQSIEKHENRNVVSGVKFRETLRLLRVLRTPNSRVYCLHWRFVWPLRTLTVARPALVFEITLGEPACTWAHNLRRYSYNMTMRCAVVEFGVVGCLLLLNVEIIS